MALPNIERVKYLLSQKGVVVSIIPHKNPDGDAIGSALALCHHLRSENINARVVSPNNLPKFLNWLPGAGDILIYEEHPKEAELRIKQSQVIFTVDFNVLHRADGLTPFLESSDAHFIMIDHHQNPHSYAEVMYSDPQASSTCQMMFYFIEQLQGGRDISQQIATCLYTGIMTDTGCFCYSNTSAETLEVVAFLVKKGADNTQIYNNIYNSKTYNSLKLLGRALSKFQYLNAYRTAYTTLSLEDLERYTFVKGDTEGFVNYGLTIQEALVSVILIEHKDENTVRLSFRSKGDIDVNHLARTYFDGGGHINAAGGCFVGSLHQAEQYLLEVLPKFFNK